MKRGKGDDDDEKVGPMFPRLHVNDTTDKGGPRAPPRNKMALYEQFSVPFQRFNPNSNSSNSLPLTPSSIMGNDPDRSCIFPVRLPSQTNIHRAESDISHQSNGANLDTLSAQIEQRKDVRKKGEGHLQVSSSRQKTGMSVESILTGEIIDSPVRQTNKILDEEDQHCSVSNILHKGDACVRQESNDIEHSDDLLNSEGSDDLSKISTLENLSSLKLSPDGVAQILGQQLFWKARRRITNQQRMYAVQVFELHRLIKVQQLIAGSSDLLLEDAAAILGKFPLQESTPKSLSLEVVVEPQTQNHKQQDHSENLNRKSECSAENGVGKTSFTYQSYGSHLSNYTPFPGNPQQENAGTQSFNPSPGHQWLIPVMSPSEGLVYKPFPGLGFNGPVYGGCGPFGQGPLDGTVMNPTYGVPNFHQAIAVSPFIPPSSYAYFPPHGVPAAINQPTSGSVVEQATQFVAHGSHDQNNNSSLVGAGFDTHNQTPCNLSNQKFGTISHVTKSRPTRERGLAGSPGEKAPGIRIEKSSSFTVPLVSDEVVQSLETRQKPQVIRVVPHNSRSATVSAARIFQSIQEERKQYDLV
ncbi:protein EARLY FLOWERING 3-like [Trifolium pratense]|uniref:protein EARLY FLOWERING 3-like n=1 Tax=Trifolium pratense TaxID=57577 RepID=UPI001E69338E|nr:protein EARLY FLOWERING 3-like [Trifolium pratense]